MLHAHHLAAAKLLGCEVLISCDEEDMLTKKIKRESNVLSPEEFLEFYK